MVRTYLEEDDDPYDDEDGDEEDDDEEPDDEDEDDEEDEEPEEEEPEDEDSAEVKAARERYYAAPIDSQEEAEALREYRRLERASQSPGEKEGHGNDEEE